MNPVSNEETLKAVNMLKHNGKGTKIISTMVLKDTSNILSKILSHILTICVKEGYFPNELKTGCITPIYKNSSKNNVETIDQSVRFLLLVKSLKE